MAWVVIGAGGVVFQINKVHRQIEVNAVYFSSPLSLFFKHLLVNPVIATIVVLMWLGILYKIDLLKVGLLFALIVSYPLSIFLKSQIVAAIGDKIVFYEYVNQKIEISTSQLVKLTKLQLGLIYKLQYSQGGRKKKIYFFPKNVYLPFTKSQAIDDLQAIISKKY